MSGEEALLPEGYETLARFVERFAIAGAANRAKLRNDCNKADREEFFNAVKDLAAPALDFLDSKPHADLNAQERRLLNLMLSFAHITLAVEMQGDDEEKHAKFREHMTITPSSFGADA